jgi:hypothetical protein
MLAQRLRAGKRRFVSPTRRGRPDRPLASPPLAVEQVAVPSDFALAGGRGVAVGGWSGRTTAGQQGEQYRQANQISPQVAHASQPINAGRWQ